MFFIITSKNIFHGYLGSSHKVFLKRFNTFKKYAIMPNQDAIRLNNQTKQKKETKMYFINTNKTYKKVRNFNSTIRISQIDPLYNSFKEGVNDTDEGMFICNIITQVIEIVAHNDVLYVSECQKVGKVYTPSTLIIKKECLVDNFYIAHNAKQILKDLGDFSPMDILKVAQKLSQIVFEEA